MGVLGAGKRRIGMDPAIAKKDELLGRREHEKNQENKGPRHKGCRWQSKGILTFGIE